jgi:hypothetical protein
VLALTATNFVGVVLFATLYALAGARVLSQAAFLACLVVLFALVTALWVRTEERHRGAGPWRRLIRIVVGLLVTLIVTPAAVLAPMFWLDDQLPLEAGLHGARGGVMAVLLITLSLVVAVNGAGAVIAAVRVALARR